MIGFGWPSGQYLGIEAAKDGDSWSLMFEQTDNDKSLYYYNSSGVRAGTKVFMSNKERRVFLESVESDMTEYVGAECYTEPIPDTLNLSSAVILP